MGVVPLMGPLARYSFTVKVNLSQSQEAHGLKGEITGETAYMLRFKTNFMQHTNRFTNFVLGESLCEGS